MNRSALIPLSLFASIAIAHGQARPSEASTAAPPPGVPIYPAVPAQAVTTPNPNAQVYVYDQKPLGGRSYLIAPEQAEGIIKRFKDKYEKLGNPRVIIYVNRDLIDENSGMKLTSQKRVVETTRGIADRAATTGDANTAPAKDHPSNTERVVSTNIFRVHDPKEVPLADKKTVRDLERLFGRPLRMAGVQLADQRVASQILGGKSLDTFALQADSEQARRDREALTKVADVVLELLVSSKETPVSELSGDRTYLVPDIQATAIRLSDARILGQATAADLIGQGPSAGNAARTYGIREIAEATALSLMEDVMLQ